VPRYLREVNISIKKKAKIIEKYTNKNRLDAPILLSSWTTGDGDGNICTQNLG
jgi:hypothetical protein